MNRTEYKNKYLATKNEFERLAAAWELAEQHTCAAKSMMTEGQFEAHLSILENMRSSL
jgi:hypothetical protein